MVVSGLVTAYEKSKVLQDLANLVLVLVSTGIWLGVLRRGEREGGGRGGKCPGDGLWEEQGAAGPCQSSVGAGTYWRLVGWGRVEGAGGG